LKGLPDVRASKVTKINDAEICVGGGRYYFLGRSHGIDCLDELIKERGAHVSFPYVYAPATIASLHPLSIIVETRTRCERILYANKFMISTDPTTLRDKLADDD
jgi:hypothetical protein